MRFKKGDRVQVRDWDDMKDRYGGGDYGRAINCKANFVNSMRQYCHKTVTIRGVVYNGTYRIEEDRGNYSWSDDMFLKCTVSEDGLTKIYGGY